MAQQTFEELVAAVKQAESRGKRYKDDGKTLTTSAKGALGEMQVMPKTIRDPGFGVTPARDKSPDEIARVGVDYLQAMKQKYGDTEKALIAYNWGPGSTDKWLAAGADPKKLPAETRTYVERVKGFLGKDVPRETSVAKKEREPLPPSLPPMAQADTKTPSVKPEAAARVASLGPGYQAALALSFLADTDDEEDRKTTITQEYLAKAQEEEDDRAAAAAIAKRQANVFADLSNTTIRSPFAEPQQPVRMKDGGDVEGRPRSAKSLMEKFKDLTSEYQKDPIAFMRHYKVPTSPMGQGLNAGYAVYKHVTGKDPLLDLQKELSQRLNPETDTGDADSMPISVGLPPVKRAEGSPKEGERKLDPETIRILRNEGTSPASLKRVNPPLELNPSAAGLPGLMMYNDPSLTRTTTSGYILDGSDNKKNVGMAQAMFLNPNKEDRADTVAHETEHLLARQNLGSGANVNSKFDELIGDKGNSRLKFVKKAVELAPYLEEKYNIKNAYFDPKMLEFQSKFGIGKNLLYEQLASLSAAEQILKVDLTKDPELRKTLFARPDVRETYNALTGLRQTRLDPRDLPPHTRVPEPGMLDAIKGVFKRADGGPVYRADGSPEEGEDVSKPYLGNPNISRQVGQARRNAAIQKASYVDDLAEAKDTARKGDAYQELEKYLQSRGEMPTIKIGRYLPDGTHGVFFSDKANIGTGDIKINKNLHETYMPSTIAHEVTHAADRQLEQQAMEQGLFGKSNQFTEAYKKMVGTDGRNRTQLLRKRYPEFEEDNRYYRSRPDEVAAHGIGAYSGPAMQDSAPRHVDATAATEFRILMDLAQRNVDKGPKGIEKIPAFFRKIFPYADGGIVQRADGGPVYRADGSPEEGEMSDKGNITVQEVKAARTIFPELPVTEAVYLLRGGQRQSTPQGDMLSGNIGARIPLGKDAEAMLMLAGSRPEGRQDSSKALLAMLNQRMGEGSVGAQMVRPMDAPAGTYAGGVSGSYPVGEGRVMGNVNMMRMPGQDARVTDYGVGYGGKVGPGELSAMIMRQKDGPYSGQIQYRLPIGRADGSPEEGEVAPRLTMQQIEALAAREAAERKAASTPAFIAQKSGIGRKAGPVSQALQSGQGQIEFLKGMTNVPQNILGAPMDISNMIANVYGGGVEKPFMGSEYIKEGLRKKGLGFTPSTDPTLAAFYGAGDLGSNLVNPAGVTRAGVQAAGKTGEAARMLAQDFQQYNQNLAVPGASYAVRNKGTPIAMSGLPFKSFVDEAEDAVNSVKVTRQGPLDVMDKPLGDWFSKKLTRYLRSDFATPDDQLVKAAEKGQLLHLAPKDFSDSASDQVLKNFLERKQSDLEYMRQVEGFGNTNMATQPYGQRIEDLTDISAYPERVGDLTPNRVPQSMRDIVETRPETRVTDYAPGMVDNLKLNELRDKMLEVRQSNSLYGAYGQPAVKIPKDYLLPDKTLTDLNVAGASNRMAKYTNWQDNTRQRMATTSLREDPRFTRAPLQDGKYLGVALPDVRQNPEVKQLVLDVGCDGGWCTRYSQNAKAYGSGDSRLHIMVTGEGKKARPVAQFAIVDSGLTSVADDLSRRFSISEIKEKGNTADFTNNPALPAIQEYVQFLDKSYGGLDYVDNLKGLRMTQLPEYPNQVPNFFEPTITQKMDLADKFGNVENGLRAVRDKAVELNNGSRFVVGTDTDMGKKLQEATNLLVPTKQPMTAEEIKAMIQKRINPSKATGGMIERHPDDNRRYM